MRTNWRRPSREAEVKRLSPNTQYKHQSYFKGVFEMIVSRSEIGRNPMANVIWSKKHLKKLNEERGDTRTALGPDGRARLFATRTFLSGATTPGDALFWAPVITRYQGLRAEEVLQLGPNDVRLHEGVWVLDIHPGSGNSLKSGAAKRMIPIHDELLRLGIVALAERRRGEGAVRLLEVKRGSLGTYSSWFSKLYHNYRVAEGIYERGQDHHSLRKDFYQDLRSGGVDYAIRVRMMGHELNDVSEGSYGPKVENMAHLKSAIDRIPVDTLHLRPVFG